MCVCTSYHFFSAAGDLRLQLENQDELHVFACEVVLLRARWCFCVRGGAFACEVVLLRLVLMPHLTMTAFIALLLS